MPTYEKGSYIDGYKVSLLMKQSDGVETYRVRDREGRLCALKYGVSASEREFSRKTELFVDEAPGYIVYRYINGETLEARLRRCLKIVESETKKIAEGILRQLSDIHRRGMAHSNLTADNIVLELGGDSPVPRIVGYGHIRPAVRADIQADLQAVGRLIYLMLTGESPKDKIRAVAGKMSPMEVVMMKALYSEFASAEEMLSALAGELSMAFIPKSSGPGFSAVAGMEALKAQLKSEVIDILADKAGAEQYGIDIPNGMLLYGPPGCGKTFLAERFAEETGYNYRYIKSSDLASTYLHGSQEKISALFDEARKNAPTILCFDEFDALVPRRDDINNASQSGEVNEFLSQLNNCGKDGVFVIATSNRPDKIDSAILRSGRIDYIVYVPVQDKEARRMLFEMAVGNRPHDDTFDSEESARLTEGMIASDITAIVQQAARIAFRTRALITNELLITVINERRPSLSKSALAEYERIRAGFESEGNDKGWKRVGFTV